MSLLLLISALFSATAWGLELEQVRVFVGERHARVLLVADGPMPGGRAAPLPPQGGFAQVELRLPLLVLDPQLAEAYAVEEGQRVIPVQQGGVERVLFTGRPEGGVTLLVELSGAREPTLIPVGENAVLLDLRAAGAPPDASLPAPELLESWIAGVSLARTAGEVSKPRPVVIIDAGHGGEDHGAVGLTGTEEADIALRIALRVARELEQRVDAEVVLTRSDDTFIPLRDRAAIANALDADLFISIHANAAPGPTAWGIETYYVDTASDAGAARVAARENAELRESAGELDMLSAQLAVAGAHQLSRDLAARVHKQTIDALREAFGEEAIRDLGVKTALFHVLVSTRCPAILFETGFLTNSEDELRLRHPVYQQVMAEAIADAVEIWLEVNLEGSR
ncbi:MAG: N-acetylmuramoyl-L-alanine amidase [Alphaproteobacteria bacterium]|nr:N-acetylmuramoyl-L-alanine amidase [Alphaproteobacteria bacterium]